MPGVINRVVAVAACRPHPMNYNRHDEGQIGDLRLSLRQFGQVRSIVVQEAGDGAFLIVAGHGLVAAAKAEGLAELRADVIPGDWAPAKVLAYLAADNELARRGSPDEAQLAALVAKVKDEADENLARLAAGSEERMRELLKAAENAAKGTGEDPGAKVDKAEEFREKWGTAFGQLWELGEHRLLCGDCKDAATVGRLLTGDKAELLLTDPPYNVGIEYGSGSNDSKTVEQNEAFIQQWFERWKTVPVKVITPGAGYYLGTLRSWLTLFPPRWMCLWLRRNSMSHSPLRGFAAWEPVLFYENEPADAETEWGGVLVYGKPPVSVGQDIFDIPVGVQADVQDDKGNKFHPTPKPLELFEVLLRKFSKADAVVVEPFCGSGTTLIACEKLGRKCRAVEIEPKFVASTLERWSVMTGKTPVLIQ